jgi:uncharacterized protein (DUF1697 family)
VRTVLSSGNVVFNARTAPRAGLERKAEIAMKKALGRTFDTFVRSQDELATLIQKDPFAAYRLPKDAKRVVSFLRTQPKVKLPPEVDGARLLAIKGGEVLTAYVPSPRGPVFMRLIEKTFGKDVTTRTWDTVRKCAAA